MIFVDTNVFMYAVGRPHPLQEQAREFFARSIEDRTRLCTSSEVLQEFMHAYIPVGRLRALDTAFSLVIRSGVEVWPLEYEDILLARQITEQYPALEARDLCHLASCRRRGVSVVMTFDRAFRAVTERPGASL